MIEAFQHLLSETVMKDQISPTLDPRDTDRGDFVRTVVNLMNKNV